MTKSITLLLLSALLLAAPSLAQEMRKGKKKSSKKNMMRTRNLTLKVTNLMYGQPFAPFFVMVHDDSAKLFEFGYPSSPELAFLAENGSPMMLMEKFGSMDGVYSVANHNEGFPYFGGDSTEIEVTVNRYFPYVTIASMAINTNDMFVAINGEMLFPGDTLYLQGLDAGSEDNDELCANVPGPACPGDSGNGSTDGEGFVHVHRGIQGVGDLSASMYDWRNPVVKVDVMGRHY